MNRLARWVSPGICVLAAVCAVSADTADTAIYGRRMVARCVEQDMASEEYGPSPFKYAATAYRIGKVTVDEEQVHVTVAFRVVYDQGCDGHDYYRPARWIERTYDIDKAVLGTP